MFRRKDTSKDSLPRPAAQSTAQALDLGSSPALNSNTTTPANANQPTNAHRSEPNISMMPPHNYPVPVSPAVGALPVQSSKSRDPSLNAANANAQAKWWVLGKTVGLGGQELVAAGLLPPGAANPNAYVNSNVMTRSSSSGGNGSGIDFAFPQHYTGSDSAAWKELWNRVLPLFNGEGLRGSIEELNDAVVEWLNECSNRPASVRQDLSELITSGTLILGRKMVIAGEETLLPRLLDLWSFFFGTVVPYVQGVFVPMKERFKDLSGITGGVGGLVGGTGNISGTGGSSNPNILIDVRAMTIISFRDQIVMPLAPRIEELSEKRVTDLSARSVQMFSVLQSVRSTAAADEKARSCQVLLQLIRDSMKLYEEASKRAAKYKEKEEAATRAAK
ncbi:hypothetical protein HDU80_001040 [Chytriomyces hyalinus]|nr:hypothetical protein HDU80_001040 [Chytriomyces hyalinus]